MKRLLYLSFALLTIFIVCSTCNNRSSDVIAHMDGHVITRGEFFQWLESRGIAAQEILKSKEATLTNLEQLAIEKLTADEALKENFDKDPYYLKLRNIIYRNYTASFYREQFAKELKFETTAADISIITINFKDDKNQKSFENSLFIMKNKVIPELSEGASFEDVAHRFSQDISSQNGGKLGYVIPSVYGDSFAKEAFKLKKGEYSPEPFIKGNSLYLIKINRFAEINEGNIDKIIIDKTNRSNVKNYLVESALKEAEKKFFDKYKVKSFIDVVSFKKSGDVIFTINGEHFTVGDLDEILKIFYELKYGFKPIEIISKESRADAGKKILSEMLLFQEALSSGIEDDKDFIKKWNLVQRSVLSGVYKYRQFSLKLLVSPKDVLNEYKNNRYTRYYRIVNTVKVPLPFAEVEDSIKNELFKTGLQLLKKSWDREILIEKNFIADEK